MDLLPEHNLVAVARSQEPLAELKAIYSHRVVAIVGDISEPEIVEEAVYLALQYYGSVDSVVANAGVLEPVKAVKNANVRQWRELFDVNFFSVVELAKQTLPHLAKAGGKFIAVLSGAASSPYYGWGAYGASKAALNHFIATLAEENPDISAIAVAPGVVATDMQTSIREVYGQYMTPETVKKFVDLHENNALLHPDVPASIYVKLAVTDWPQGYSGRTFRYNDEALQPLFS